MLQVALGVLAVVSLTGCASMAPQIPPPHDSDSAGLFIDIKVRVSGLLTYRADIVYFVKNCLEKSEQCDNRLIASNYAKEGRIYLLNATPGEYRAVAAAFDAGIPGDDNLYFTYFPNSLINSASIQAAPNSLAFAGSYLVSASYGVCPDSAEAIQLKYAELIEPGTPKCGLFKMTMHKLASGDFIFVGGKAYSVGKQTYHYRGTAYEKQDALGGQTDYFESASNDLIGTGWEGLIKIGR